MNIAIPVMPLLRRHLALPAATLDLLQLVADRALLTGGQMMMEYGPQAAATCAAAVRELLDHQLITWHGPVARPKTVFEGVASVRPSDMEYIRLLLCERT